jgi:prepilin-type N-terminal cleavage/methylation domain-containing protein
MNIACRSIRRGMTLIELLVVVSIMLLLTAVAVPAMKPAMENRKFREAARAVNVYLSTARTRAIELGRPVGVVLSRSPMNPNMAVSLEQIQMPPMYAGMTEDTRAVIYLDTSTGTAVAVARIDPNASPKPRGRGYIGENVVCAGDLIQFGGQGAWYQILSSTLTTYNTTTGYVTQSSGVCTMALRAVWPTGYVMPWGYTDSPALSFQVIRQPFQVNSGPAAGQLSSRRSLNKPIQLPSGVAIDLHCSGTDAAPLAFAATDHNTGRLGIQDDTPVILMFSPTGSINRVWVGNSMWPLVDSPFLLLGRRDRVFDPADPTAALPEDRLANWQDANNLWVVVNAQSGSVKTVENSHLDPHARDSTNKRIYGDVYPNEDDITTYNAVRGLQRARELASQGQSMGGR